MTDALRTVFVFFGEQALASILTNKALLLLEDTCVSEPALELVMHSLKQHSIFVRSSGPISTEEILSRGIIDEHFYKETLNLHNLNLKNVTVPRLKFESKFGLAWKTILRQKKAFTALTAARKLGIPEVDVANRWQAAVKKGDVMSCRHKLDTIAVGKIEVKKETYFVCGGELLSKRQRFVAPQASTYYFSIEWDSTVLQWGEFNESVIGTASSNAPPQCLSRTIRENWEELGLEKSPSRSCVHASSSPVTAMIERINWLDWNLETEHFALALKACGMARCLDTMRYNPLVTIPDATNPVTLCAHAKGTPRCAR